MFEKSKGSKLYRKLDPSDRNFIKSVQDYKATQNQQKKCYKLPLNEGTVYPQKTRTGVLLFLQGR